MSLSREEISEILGDYELGYSRSSIEKSLACILYLWGRKFFDYVRRDTRWLITELIDTGLIIDELKGKDGSEDLFERLYRKERAAFSEARLAAFFSKLGFEVVLNPESKHGKYNDLSVKIGDVWVNIEVKTPEESELKQDLNREIDKVLEFNKIISIPRKIQICLAKEPTPEDIEALHKHTIEQASKSEQPTYGLINNIAWVKTDYPDKIEKTGLRWYAPIPMPQVPLIFKDIYEKTISSFHLIIGFHGDEQISIGVNVPFEDPRLFSFIRKKSKQLNEKTPNIVAIDTTAVSLSYPKSRERVLNMPQKEIQREWSRRIGTIILYQTLNVGGKVTIAYSLMTHPNPYIPIPSRLLEKCNLEKYPELIEI